MLKQQVEPNRHALPPSLGLLPGRADVRGYQCFKIRPSHDGDAAGIPVPDSDDIKLVVKRQLLGSYFHPRIMRHRSMLDIGANAGFFTFWGASAGLDRADAIDVDPQYTRMCQDIAQHVGATAVHAHTSNLMDWHRPADIVLAFAMVHWLYSATTGLGSLQRVVQLLAARTQALLLIEWVSPSDSAIQFLGHTDINRDDSATPYSYELFRSELGKEFELVEPVGRVSSTRTLLACWKNRRLRELDLSWEQPLLLPPDRIWSARCVANDHDGVRLWSRVYDGGDRIVKQASPRLARAEAASLTALAHEDGFPRLIKHSELSFAEGVCEIEKIIGTDAVSYANVIQADRIAAINFCRELVSTIVKLRKHHLVHRDVRPANVLVRNGRPVLIDFGWASRIETVGDTREFVPASLGEGYRPAGFDFDDSFSAGKLLLELLGNAHPDLSAIAAALSASDPSARLKPEPALKLFDRL